MSKQLTCESLRSSPSPSKYSSYLKRKKNKVLDYPVVYPSWLMQRNDFQEIFREYEDLESLDLPRVFQKESKERKPAENDAIHMFTESCFFFRNVFAPFGLLRKFFVSSFALGDDLYAPEDKKVHIILSGEVLLDNEIRIGRYNIIGESQITEYKNLSAVALEKVNVLSIFETDYRTLFMHCRIKQNRQIIPILCKILLFSEVKQLRIEKIASIAIPLQYAKNSKIFEIGDKSHYLFIILSGTVELSSEIKIKSMNDLPIGLKKREKLITEKRYFQPVLTLSENEFFGISDISSGSLRKTTAKTLSDTILFAVKWAELLEIVTVSEKQSIFSKISERFTHESLTNSLISKKSEQRRHISALLQASEVKRIPYGREVFDDITQRKRLHLQKLLRKQDEYANENLVSKSYSFRNVNLPSIKKYH